MNKPNQSAANQHQLLEDIKRAIKNNPEFALEQASKEYFSMNNYAVNYIRIYGDDSQANDLSILAENSRSAFVLVEAIVNGAEPSLHDMALLLETKFAPRLAIQNVLDEQEFGNQNMVAANAESPNNSDSQMLSTIEVRASKHLAKVGKHLISDVTWANADLDNFSRIQDQSIWQIFAAVQIAENSRNSPEYKAALEAHTPGIGKKINELDAENSRRIWDKEERKQTETATDVPLNERATHSKLFDMADVPSAEIMDARVHFGTRVSEYAARANGGPYKGEILETDSHLVQLVSGKSIVFHRKSDVTLPDGLQKVNGQELSIYYKEGAAKAYRLDPVKDQLDRTVASLDRAAKGMGLPEVFGEQLAQARNEAWKGIQAARNPIRETKEPTQEQDAPTRSPSR